MKRIFRKGGAAVIILILCFFAFVSPASSFYSALSGKTVVTVNSGSVDVEIQNLIVDNNEISFYGETGYSGMLRLNRSAEFSFAVKNCGKSSIDYSVILEIAWEDELPESGKFVIYPSAFSDEEIYSDLKNNVNSGAVIYLDALDNTQIELLSSIREGISVSVDSGFLDSLYSDGESYENAIKSYSYKIFFFEDDEVVIEPHRFHDKQIEVGIRVDAGLYSNPSIWKKTVKSRFNLTSVSDNLYPVINEIQNAKTFFITQAESINLNSYAVANDYIDGDITHRIVVSSVPEFNPLVSGTYAVTYNVTNSYGYSAVPLTISITVWDFTKIESGNYHTLALTSHGKVYAWGYNVYSQLGDGTTADRSVPVPVAGLENIIDIAAGNGCSYALGDDGQAYSWGRNDNGRLGDNTTTIRRSPVKVFQTEGVRFVSIASRFHTAGGVTDNGDVYTWGYGGYGAAGTGGVADLLAPVKINLSNIAQIDLGYYNGAAVTNDGLLYTWGDNLHGQLGNGAAMVAGANAPAIVPYFRDNNIKIESVATGWYHMAAVTESGNLFTWGYGYEGRLGNNSAADKNTPQSIALPFTVIKAEAGFYHTGIISSNNEVYFAGQNAYGKHGTGNVTNHTTFIQTSLSELPEAANATNLSLALDSSFILLDNTHVYGTGYGGTGVLGTGNNNNQTTPQKWAFIPPDPH